MSRSLGLREDQQDGARLVARIIGFLTDSAVHCRSELAREEPESAVLNQMRCVIVGDFREQARSYRRGAAFK
jgi:hypothetical protein